ncbi:hypothetical protein KFL_000500110 [Klebsormidium nitens]|uniref:G-patch domain-containing protein n=1 Tax=Klebsormidium nitens TaxID=105231 RepID=A0A1Y1HSU2_KLENI|nr:hypothetical protein KFL_000500110 [Klebsormidium nitens]|eukprot:GAQ80259.1 hypothetical protein KFL_000500110 [Klebsormidium nitens]
MAGTSGRELPGYAQRVASFAAHAQAARQGQRSEAEADSLREDSLASNDEFSLPIGQRPEENLRTDGLEIATLDTQISSTNVGYRMLQKMGWSAGQGLGRNAQGIVDPIRGGVSGPKLGLGKQEQDDFYTAEENIQRKKLEVEIEETEEVARQREVVAERTTKIEAEVAAMRKTFLCDLCNKQYKLAIEYEAHLSSYDHNHKKRFRDMKQQQAGPKDERIRREQVRAERELLKQQQRLSAQQSSLPLQAEPAGLPGPAPPETKAAAVAAEPGEGRAALKFGFGSSKPVGSKAKPATFSKLSGGGRKKQLIQTAAVFSSVDSDEES